jgi:hypothetical protein
MERLCCVCKSKHVMLYSEELHMGWCENHMPRKEDYEMALQGSKYPRELCEPNI